MRKHRGFLVVLFCLVAAASALAGTAKVLTNHIGYAPDSAKRAVIEGQQGDTFDAFKVIEAESGKVVLTGAPVHAGPVQKWKDWDFWTVDFSGLKQEGTYIIEASSPKGAIRSYPFLVQKNVLERNALSDVVYYFKGQRSSGLWDKADRKLKFDGKDGEIDARGGWFDATGDYGKHMSHLSFSTYFNPQQVSQSAWSLFKSYQELDASGNPYFKQYKKRLLDEAMFGADYLVRMRNPNGSFYITVSGRGPEKKPEDRIISAKAERHIILTPETKDKVRDYGREKIKGDAAFEAGYREGAG
ncbi:MAG TPA: glycoside hydrolase family 9 protein, partial [Acidobacteriota bacterium]|nr:glycoside hydrolase family 9 protein [Acidobacteriota bacterium]